MAIVVDDDSVIRALLKKVLTSAGYETKLYDSALKVPCLASPTADCCVFEDNIPELLITDIKMYGMTGVELIRYIRKKSCKIKKIAIISGYWDENYREVAKELNCTKFEKPLNVDEIMEWVNQ